MLIETSDEIPHPIEIEWSSPSVSRARRFSYSRGLTSDHSSRFSWVHSNSRYTLIAKKINRILFDRWWLALLFLGVKPTGLLYPRLQNNGIAIWRSVRVKSSSTGSIDRPSGTERARYVLYGCRASTEVDWRCRARGPVFHADFRRHVMRLLRRRRDAPRRVAPRAKRPSLARRRRGASPITRSIYLLPMLSIDKPSDGYRLTVKREDEFTVQGGVSV